MDYFRRVAALPLAPDGEDPVEAMNGTGLAVIGTPDDAIAQIARLQVMGHEWADTAQTRRSYELFARYVAPHFQGGAATLTGSRDWAAANRGTFIGEAGAAVMSAMQRHEEEKKA